MCFRSYELEKQFGIVQAMIFNEEFVDICLFNRLKIKV